MAHIDFSEAYIRTLVISNDDGVKTSISAVLENSPRRVSFNSIEEPLVAAFEQVDADCVLIAFNSTTDEDISAFITTVREFRQKYPCVPLVLVAPQADDFEVTPPVQVIKEDHAHIQWLDVFDHLEGWMREQLVGAYQPLLDAFPKPTFLFDALGRVWLQNQSAEQFSTQLTKPFIDYVNEIPVFSLVFSQTRPDNTGIIPQVELALDNEQVAYSTFHFRHFEDDKRNFKGVLLTLEDVTSLVETEQAKRRHMQMIDIIQEINATLTGVIEPDTVMDLILGYAVRVVPHTASNLMLLQDNDKLSVSYAKGYDDVRYPKPDLDLPMKEFVFFKYEADLKEVLLIPSTQDDPCWQELSMPTWVQSFLCVPILVSSRLIGFINFESDIPHTFKPEDTKYFKIFAVQVANVVANTEFYHTIAQSADEIHKLHSATSFLFSSGIFTSTDIETVSKRIVKTVVQEMDKTDCCIVLYEKGKPAPVLRRVARAGTCNLFTGETTTIVPGDIIFLAIQQNRIVRANFLHPELPEETHVTRIIIPLRTHNDTIGVLDIRSSTPGVLDERDINILEAFAEHAASAIENVQLHHEIQQRVEERTAELSRVKERAEAILNHSSDAILLVRSNGTIQQGNRAFVDMFGYPDYETFGMALVSFATPELREQIKLVLDRVLLKGVAGRIEIPLKRFDGSVFDADILVSPIIPEHGNIISVVCSIRDITQRRLMERELRFALQKERELVELKTRFISRASHEFRTPLASLLIASEMLNTYGERMTKEQRTERIERMQFEIKHLTLMLDDMLELSKSEEIGHLEFRPSHFDLAQLSEEIVNEIQDGIGINHQILLSIQSPQLELFGDRKLIRRVLINLLSNSVKYSPVGTAIDVILQEDESNFSLTVRDRGIGIPEEDQKFMFEAFHRAQNVGTRQGTGLGLAIVKQSIYLHGGEIKVYSHLNQGTEFVITLPRLKTELL